MIRNLVDNALECSNGTEVTMRRALIVLGVATAVSALAAQQPALKSGIEIGNVDTSVRPQDDF